MGFSTSAAIVVLFCMALSINAQQASKLGGQQASKLGSRQSSKLGVDAQPSPRGLSHQSWPSPPSPSSNINMNSNKNNNDNLILSSLFAELMSNQNIEDQDLCDEDDDSCFWRMIGAKSLAKSPVVTKENQEDAAASGDETESVNVEKSSDAMERGHHAATGSENLNFNSNSNRNSNYDFISAFASLQQFLSSQKKLTKQTPIVE